MPAPNPGVAQAVVWTNLVNATASGNSLNKTGGCNGCYDAGAVSQQRITGDGYVEFTAGATGPLRVAGLTLASTVGAPGNIHFSIRLQDTLAEVRESGVYYAATAYAASDVFRIAVQSGVVHYSRNGTVFYTSRIPPSYPLMLGAALSNRPGGIQNAMIAGSASSSGPSPAPAPAPGGQGSVTWINVVNATVSGSTLIKTGGCDGCYDAGAVSQQQIVGGNGYAQFTAGGTGPLRVAGLASSLSGTNPASIAFGIRLQGFIAEVREGGAYRADIPFAAGDVFRITVQAGVVRYSKNGTVFFTSATATPSTLSFAATFSNLNGSIGSAVLANGQ